MVRLEQGRLKGTKKYGAIFNKDIPRINEFMNTYSESTRNQVRNKLIYFIEWIKGKYGVENVLKIEYDQVKDFLESVVDKRAISAKTKNRWRTNIRKYYDFINNLRDVMKDGSFEKNFKISKKDFINPVPKHFSFSNTGINLNEIKTRYFTQNLNYSHALKLLNYFYFENFEMFIALSLLCYSGPRVQELVSIKISNIENNNPIEFTNDEGELETINLRFFLTRLKGTSSTEKVGVYYFPEFLTNYIELYLEQLQLKLPGETYLFPSPRVKNQHLSPKSIRVRLKKASALLKINVNVRPHRFRALLNTWRTRKGVDPTHRSLLLNHTIKTVEGKSYNLDYKEFIQMQKLYDEAFPFPNFKPDPNYLKSS